MEADQKCLSSEEENVFKKKWRFLLLWKWSEGAPFESETEAFIDDSYGRKTKLEGDGDIICLLLDVETGESCKLSSWQREKGR